MTRIGKKPIEIPQGVTVAINGDEVVVKGPKGELSHTMRPEIGIELDGSILTFQEKIATKNSTALWGTTRALIANMIEGVTNGFEKKLDMVGVGYRAKKDSDTKITLSIGFSHPVEILAPQGITLDVEDQTGIIVRGIDKQAVGQIAAEIRKIRKPEPYKGKGIKYSDESIRRKAGKTGKV